jgi:polyhydroxyalkanoate synthesis repressor PhaR
MHYKVDVYLIKRYSNRRLYDPQANRSITLDDLAELVKRGSKIKVVESKSGKDVTARVLGQALITDMKRWKDTESKVEIIKLMISEGEGAVDILKKTYLAGLGAFEITKSKAEEIIDTLIKKGEIKKGERSDAVMELMDKVEDNVKSFKDKVSTEVESKIENMKVAKKADLENLETKVDSLIETLAKLEEKLSPKKSEDKPD